MWHWFQDDVTDRGKKTVSGGWKKTAKNLVQETRKNGEETTIETKNSDPCYVMVKVSPAETWNIIHPVTWWTFEFEQRDFQAEMWEY